MDMLVSEKAINNNNYCLQLCILNLIMLVKITRLYPMYCK